ncbi:DUF7096 domain-containing protein [Haloarcula litorea]|uniref:DUF7096 domain-containing protein n=1 Tax=Haloarcula litorea TaxID=3032579 RepID=UPI0023E81221|nr:hypothetical protein [Halomicroarcula sp. GDY20]
MRPRFALLVALLLVGATATPAAGWATTTTASGPAPRIAEISNTTNHLAIPGDQVRAAEYNDSGIDVGAAVAVGSRDLHQQHEAAAFTTEFRRLESEAQRRQLLRSTLSAIETREAELDRSQQRALERYAAGETTASDLLRTRALVDTEARALSGYLSAIERTVRIAPDYSMTDGMGTRLDNVQGNVRVLYGPVGDRLASTLGGADEPDVAYVEASETGYTVAVIDDGQYVRETRLGDERAPSLPDEFAAAAEGDPGTSRLDVADERASTLYDWLYDRQRPSFFTYGTSGIYRLSADYPGGRLTAYLDGGTTNVFYELQHHDLATVRTTTGDPVVNDGLRVVVQRSYQTGPMRVTVSDNGTGQAVDARVAVDGRQVGRTGSDGALWIVEPRGPATVNVTSGGADVSVPIDA